MQPKPIGWPEGGLVVEPSWRVELDFGDGHGMRVLEREPFGSGKADGWVESVRVRREIATSLPEQVRGTSGVSAADATVVLVAPTLDPGYWSPWRFSDKLDGQPIRISVGYSGVFVRVFTGRVQSHDFRSDDNTVGLVCEDLSSDWREAPGGVNLDVFTQAVQNEGYAVLDQLAGNVLGERTIPEPTGTVRVQVSNQGSLFPEVGGLVRDVAWPRVFRQFVVKSNEYFSRNDIVYSLSSNVSAGTAFTCVFRAENDREGAMAIDFFHQSGSTHIPRISVSYENVLNNRTLAVVETLSGGFTNLQYFTLTHPGNMFRVLVNVPSGSSGTVTVWQEQSGSWVNVGTYTTLQGTPNPLSRVRARGTNPSGDPCGVGAFAVASGNQTFNAWRDWPDWTLRWERPKTRLRAFPPGMPDATAWDVIQELAAAEFGAAGLDEYGRLWFKTMASLKGSGQTPYILSADVIESISGSSGLDGLRSSVEVPATPVNIADGRWEADTAIEVPNGGMTMDVDTDFVIVPESPNTFTTSYKCRATEGGSGASRTVSITVTQTAPQKLRVKFGSPSGGLGGWLVDDDGNPAFSISGFQSVQPADEQIAVVENTGVSINNKLSVDASPMRQQLNVARSLATSLAADLATIRPVLDDVTLTVPEPRLQLGDLVKLVDPVVTGADLECVVESIELSSDSGISQSIGVRPV